MEAEEKPTPIGLRAPPDLAAWLKAEAAENQRSVASQAVWALNQFRKHAVAQGTAQ
ncbi:hypothetical protein D3C87_1628150 [compost metagenome]